VAKLVDRRKMRRARHARVRKKIVGTPERPRLAVFKSLKHIYAQIIDDSTGRTLIAVSTLSKDFPKAKGTKTELARKVGEMLGEKALKAGISEVVFDRGGYKYHGRVKALADSAREKGLKF